MKHLVVAFLVLSFALLGGCSKSREAGLVGDWKSSQPQGGNLTLKEDKTFAIPIPAPNGGNISGKWSLEENTVVLRPEMFGTKTKAEALKELEEQVKKVPQLAQMAEPLKKTLDRMDLVLAEGDKSGTLTLALGPQSQTVTYTKIESK